MKNKFSLFITIAMAIIIVILIFSYYQSLTKIAEDTATISSLQTEVTTYESELRSTQNQVVYHFESPNPEIN